MTPWAWSSKGRAYARSVARPLWTSLFRWAERVQWPDLPIATFGPAAAFAECRAQANRAARSACSAAVRRARSAKWPRLSSPSATLVIVGSVALATYTIAFDARPPEGSIDRLVLDKSERRLIAFCQGTAWKSYTVALGRVPVGAKRFAGDGKTPEGLYTIDWRNEESDYYRALHVSYPRSSDVAYAKRHRRSPGGAIMIHGTPDGYGPQGSQTGTYDWTDGCIAVTNDEIEELWLIVPDGTPIEIRP